MANGAAFCYSSFKFVLLFSRKGMCASTIRSMNETPQSVCRQIPSYSDHFVQGHREKRSVLLNQRCSRLQELGSRRVAMTILCQLVERVQKAAAQADISRYFIGDWHSGQTGNSSPRHFHSPKRLKSASQFDTIHMAHAMRSLRSRSAKTHSSQ